MLYTPCSTLNIFDFSSSNNTALLDTSYIPFTINTSEMLSIFGRAGATPLVVPEKSHALSCVL